MAKDAIFQIRMDTVLKEQVEDLYKQMGTTFAEAVRVFARQSVISQSMPIMVKADNGKNLPSRIGIARDLPYRFDDIDEFNNEIADMFEEGTL